jgi:hypothetical protein
MAQIFVSHTKKDNDFCDRFDNICASVGIRRFRSEFENVSAPPYKTIRNAMNNSIALFFLIGKELSNNQALGGKDWEFTQNWIAYEIGLACQLGIDVWAVCDDVPINFPMPYINNYSTVTIGKPDAFNYMRSILNGYLSNLRYPFPHIDISGNWGIVCAYNDCKMEFNYHVQWIKGDQILCPQCLRPIIFLDDCPLIKKQAG